jgi:hypothetical protein
MSTEAVTCGEPNEYGAFLAQFQASSLIEVGYENYSENSP